MKKHFYTIVFSILSLSLFSQNIPKNSNSVHTSLSDDLFQKVLSGKLLEKISAKKYQLKKGEITQSESLSKVVIYFEDEPQETQKTVLEDDGVICYWETWTPPMKNHPYGFVLAELPVEKFEVTLSKNFVKKMDTAEYEAQPQNNNGNQSIRAPEVWNTGFDGSGVKVGVLDSGLDSYYKGSDLPSSYEAFDYYDYPNIDTDVENLTTGHGTHVAGTVLGRGILSAGHSHMNNGQGAFAGVAPGADLLFMKIGGDASSSSTDFGTIAAIDAAVDQYDVDVLSMSYGGWDTYHDGSAADEQKVDWAYQQGVPFFISAGNSGDEARHYSGTVAANSSTDFIEVNVDDPGGDDVTLWFNLIWYDGLGTTNNLSLEYYDETKTKITNIVQGQNPTESPRGTESKYSHYNNYITSPGTYYLKVVNNSSNSQFFHIFDDWGSYVTFANPDENYTIGSPASADYAMAVAAYVTRETWTDSNGDDWWYGPSYVLNGIAPFSSRGPRVDDAKKPDIAAPGHVILSLRDTDVYTSPTEFWIDNDGVPGGDANYYLMQGTSMACPHAAGAAALLLQKYPSYTPGQVYNAFKDNANTSFLPSTPNEIWGYGKLDIYEAVTSGGTAAVASVDVTHLTIQNGSNQIGTASFVLSNLGGASLNYNITVDGDFTLIAANGSNEQFVIKNVQADQNSEEDVPKIKFGELKSTPNLSKSKSEMQITGEDFLVLDDGGNQPDAFIGWGVGSDFNWMNEFVLNDFDFNLDALNFYMRTETASTNTVYIEVLDEFMTTLASGEIDFGLSSEGDWFRATLNPPIDFSQGETFYISVETLGSGIQYPAGADKNGLVIDQSYYFDGVDWTNLNTFGGYENGAWLIRAEGTAGSTFDRITVTPESGTIQPGGSQTIQITFDATGLSNNTYTGEVNITSNGGSITIPIDFIVGVDDLIEKPVSFELHQNYPNPFNPSTKINYSLPASSKVSLVVYDILGRKIKTLVNEFQNAGKYNVDFNAEHLSSGVYFYRLSAGRFSETRKLLLLR
jgi:subtilisin family serine protease